MNYLIFQLLSLLTRSHLTQLILQIFYLQLQLLLITTDLVLLCTHHHQRLQTLLLPVCWSSLLILWLMLEFLLRLLYLSLVGFKLSFTHLIVWYLIGRDKAMWVILLLWLIILLLLIWLLLLRIFVVFLCRSLFRFILLLYFFSFIVFFFWFLLLILWYLVEFDLLSMLPIDHTLLAL
jgi:hypothetical protein